MANTTNPVGDPALRGFDIPAKRTNSEFARGKLAGKVASVPKHEPDAERKKS